MLEKAISVLLVIVGLINIAPIIVFFSPDQAKKLYGLPIEGESLTILMRHRAVLLSIVGFALIYAVFRPEVRMLAIILAFISKIAFMFLLVTSNDYTPEIKQVALIDVGAMVLLVVVLGLHFGK